MHPDTGKRVRSGDIKAFEEVYKSLYQPLYEYAYSFTKAKESAEDAVQEVFRRVWEVRIKFPDTDDIRPYLFASVRNRVYKEWKHERIVEQSATLFNDDIPGLGESSDDPESGLNNSDIRAALEDIIASIPDNRREIILLRWRLGLSYPEIAQTLGISVEAAQAQVSRLQRALRPLLKGLLD